MKDLISFTLRGQKFQIELDENFTDQWIAEVKQGQFFAQSVEDFLHSKGFIKPIDNENLKESQSLYSFRK